MKKQIIIDPKYNGPLTSGNGGYSSGILAETVSYPVQVTLRLPPPLGVSMDISIKDDQLAMLDGEKLVAQAKPYDFEMDLPQVPDYEEAIKAAKKYQGHTFSPFPSCFVCGTGREEGDGLRIFTGKIEENIVAGPWSPFKNLAGEDGFIQDRFIWSALDCPGAWATEMEDRMIVLGRMAMKKIKELSVKEDYIVMGWERGVDGRKVYAGTAIFTKNKELCAMAEQTWIAIKN